MGTFLPLGVLMLWCSVYELHVYSSMWSEAEALSEYGKVPELFTYLFLHLVCLHRASHRTSHLTSFGYSYRHVFKPRARMLEVVLVASVTAVVMYCCSYLSPCAPVPEPMSLGLRSRSHLPPDVSHSIRSPQHLNEWHMEQETTCDIMHAVQAGAVQAPRTTCQNQGSHFISRHPNCAQFGYSQCTCVDCINGYGIRRD
jgi:hypothetical protein